MTRELRPTEFAAPIVPDARDTRDFLYGPPGEDLNWLDNVPPDEYRRLVGTTWHQRGQECTGFALAAIANYSIRRLTADPERPSVSRRMLYESAQIHDGQDFEEGSTLRGALKGWRRTGVASDDLWPYHPDDEHGEIHGRLTLARLLDARHRPLVSYRRIPSDDLARMRHALSEGHALFAAARIHVGWYRLFVPEAAATIDRRLDDDHKGGHAFVIVGYDHEAFWIHNSWGPEWGDDGYARIEFDDWAADGHDAWVVELDPEHFDQPTAPKPPRPAAKAPATAPTSTASYRDLWPHLVVLSDDGRLAADGLYEMDEGSVGTLLYLFGERSAAWSTPRLAIITDDGRHPITDTIENYRAVRDRYMAAEIYPIFVVWETPWEASLVDELDRWTRHVAREANAGEPPFELVDLPVRPAVRASVARPIWDQLVQRSELAASTAGGAEALAVTIAKKRDKEQAKGRDFEIHLVTAGVGDLLQSRLVSRLPTPVATATIAGSSTPLDQGRRTYGARLHERRLHELAMIGEVGGDEPFGPIDATALEVIAHLLAAHADGRPVELLGHSVPPDVPHDASRPLDDQAIEIILGYDAATPARPEYGPAAAANAAVTPALDDLPRDPLARAEALRARRR